MITFLHTLPNVELAFAYGSGAFHQPKLYTSRDALPLLDFIFAVRDPLNWHAQNLSTNPSHYSGLAKYGPKWIEFVSNRIGVGLHFNTYVPYEDRFVKYGVIGLEAMKSDLLTWKDLYVSGRLHKPVRWIRQSPELTNEVKFNNQAAFAAALILSPRSFNRKELYQLVCQLSYSGDIRMRFAEDKSKIERIVEGSFSHFEALYNSELVHEITTAIHLEEDQTGTLHINPAKKLNLLPFLPQSVREGLAVKGQSLPSLQMSLQSILSQRVSLSSRRQAIAGLLGIGLSKGAWYLKEKIKKSWTSTLIKNLNS